MVCEDIAHRQQFGLHKYGISVKDSNLTRFQWLKHLYEELLDAAVYARKLISIEIAVDKIDSTNGASAKACPSYSGARRRAEKLKIRPKKSLATPSSPRQSKKKA